MCIVYVCVCVKNKAQLHRAKVFTKKHSALLSMVRFHAGFNPEWKNCNPGCKFPPISAVGVVIMVLRCLHLLPQNPTRHQKFHKSNPAAQSVTSKQSAQCSVKLQTFEVQEMTDLYILGQLATLLHPGDHHVYNYNTVGLVHL